MRPLRFLSLFSGLEAASLAWEPLGWICAGVAEIEPFPCSLLVHRFPHAPNLGDVMQITEAQIAALGPLDVIVFGSPCQDLSRAGSGKGLAGTKSHLFFHAIRIAEWARKHCGVRWALWENVRGALTSNDGFDFAAVVQHMADLPDQPAVPPRGWGSEGVALGRNLLEWGSLDAQWFGVAQRRRRVFCLADFGDWRSRPPVLLERDGLRGDRPPQRRCNGHTAACPAGGAGACECVERGMWWDGGQVSQTLDAVLHKGQMMPEKNRFPVVLVPARGATSSSLATCPSATAVASRSAPTATITLPTANAPALRRTTPTTTDSASAASYRPASVTYRARKLTPIEAERLFGIPDNHTLIPHNGKPAADLPRYAALGNTMAVTVMRWIGQSIEFAHNY